MAIADIQLDATQATLLRQLESDGFYLQESGSGSFTLRQRNTPQSTDVPANVARSLLEAQFIGYCLHDASQYKITRAGRVWLYWH